MDLFRFPLTKPALFLIIGIVTAHYLTASAILLPVMSVITFAAMAMAYHSAQKHMTWKIHFAAATYCLFFFIGFMTAETHRFDFRKSHYLHHAKAEEKCGLQIILIEKLRPSVSGVRYVAAVRSIGNKQVSGKILVHFKGRKSNFRIGNVLAVYALPVRNGKPKNPEQFDYSNYLDNKAIPAQLFLNAEDFKVLRTDKNIWFYADALRFRIISQLEKSGFGAEELQVLNALILGQQQEIAPEIVRNYQYAGAVHILSVSGLHVGFILLFLNFILSPLPKTRFGNTAKLLILLLSLWGFALIAGLSPPVVRSATMFSFVALGMYLRRSTNIFHTLLVSIMLILLFEPAFLFDVGFQLSYAALFFIIWLQPSLSVLWSPQNRIVKYFWEILTVSFAAQIGTLPLALYYFHQFPGLFFATNLAVIPFLSIIMLLGVLTMFLAAVGYTPAFLIIALEKSIGLLNWIIGEIASLEQFIFRDIPFGFWMTVGLYLLIVCTFLWLKKPDGNRLVSAMSGIAIFQLSFFITQWKSESETEFVVFNSKNQTLLVWRRGKEIITTGNRTAALDSYKTAHFVRREKHSPLQNVFWHDGQKIIVIDSACIVPEKTPDILLLIKSPKINLDRCLKLHKPKIVVADASNFRSYAKRWKETCRKQKIPFHYTNEKGFFRLQN